MEKEEGGGADTRSQGCEGGMCGAWNGLKKTTGASRSESCDCHRRKESVGSSGDRAGAGVQ